jgi:hypothetical protein
MEWGFIDYTIFLIIAVTCPVPVFWFWDVIKAEIAKIQLVDSFELTIDSNGLLNKLENKIDGFVDEYISGFDEIAKALGIRTNLQSWKDKTIAEQFKFILKKIKKLRAED